MTGPKNGVAKLLLDDEPRALYTHCYELALNLAVGDFVKQCGLMRSALDVLADISKLVKKSPKRDAAFEKLKTELVPNFPGFRVLCPTQWIVRAATRESLLNNYNVLLALWEESLAGSLDSDMRARILGVEAQLVMFDFIFGVMLSSLLLCHTDHLPACLQQKCMSAGQGQHSSSLTVSVLQSVHNEEHFNAFFQCICQE